MNYAKCLAAALAALSVSLARAALLYDLTQPNPPVGFANLDQDVVMMDDVLIPVDRLAGQPRISVTRADTAIFTHIQGIYTVTEWVAKARIVGGQLQPEFPLTRLGSSTFILGANQVNTISWVAKNGGESFSLPVLPFNFQGNDYGVFFFGLSFSAPLQNIGWCLATGPDTNLDGFYAYYGDGDSRNGVKLLDGYRASFNLKITGSPVPEPTTCLLVSSGLALVMRRRRCAWRPRRDSSPSKGDAAKGKVIQVRVDAKVERHVKAAGGAAYVRSLIEKSMKKPTTKQSKGAIVKGPNAKAVSDAMTKLGAKSTPAKTKELAAEVGD